MDIQEFTKEMILEKLSSNIINDETRKKLWKDYYQIINNEKK